MKTSRTPVLCSSLLSAHSCLLCPLSWSSWASLFLQSSPLFLLSCPPSLSPSVSSLFMSVFALPHSLLAPLWPPLGSWQTGGGQLLEAQPLAPHVSHRDQKLPGPALPCSTRLLVTEPRSHHETSALGFLLLQGQGHSDADHLQRDGALGPGEWPRAREHPSGPW